MEKLLVNLCSKWFAKSKTYISSLPSLLKVKSTFLPLGDQPPDRLIPLKEEIFATDELTISLTKKSGFPSSKEVKERYLPSGDQRGDMRIFFPSRSLTSPEPSKFTEKRSEFFPFFMIKAMRVEKIPPSPVRAK